MTTLSPRELAASAGISTDTLRHYEKSGVLPKPARTRAGYRRYPADAARRVALVRRALAIGFSIKELARVFRERDQGGAPCRKVRAIVGDRLAPDRCRNRGPHHPENRLNRVTRGVGCKARPCPGAPTRETP